MSDQPLEPKARPFFRGLAALLALLMLIAAIWYLFEHGGDDRLVGYLLFTGALWFGGMALTGSLPRGNEERSISLRQPEPQARPFFRGLAVVLALVMLVGAIYWVQSDRRLAGFLLFGGALWFGGMAWTGRSIGGGK
jgi:ferric-dicitrate binding protein FerR (iron transport regulator)